MAAKATERAQPRSILVWVVEIFSVATAACFVLAAIAHETIFWFWNLDFFTLATPGDVLMSGLAMLVRLPPLLLVGYLYYRFAILRGRLMLVGALVLLAAAILISEAIGWNYVVSFVRKGGPSDSLFFAHMYFPNSSYLLCSASAAVAGYWLQRRASGKATKAPYLATMTAVACAALGAGLFIQQMVASGFEPRGVRVADQFPCGDQQLLWIGERSIVAHCGGEIRVLHQFENVRIISHVPEPMWRRRGGDQTFNTQPTFEQIEKGAYRREREAEALRLERLKWREEEEARMNAATGQNISIANDPPKNEPREEW